MQTVDERKALSVKERRFLEYVAKHYTPPPLTPARRAAFDQALEERIARSAHRSFFGFGAAMAAALAAVFFWIVLPAPPSYIAEKPREDMRIVKRKTQETEHLADLFSYPFEEPRADRTNSEGEENDYLPGEYIALALALEL